MRLKKRLVIFLAGISGAAILASGVQAAAKECRPCRDVQSAANLASIEKRLRELSLNSSQNLDEEAKDWYAKFQKGGLFFDGWQEISDDVVSKIPSEKKYKIKITMLALGVKIGCEWSKENDVRKISTDMLQEWGKKIRKTTSDSPDHLIAVISSIEHEVNELLF